MSDDLEEDWALIRPELARVYKGRQGSYASSPLVVLQRGGEFDHNVAEGRKIAWGPDTGAREDHRAAASFLARKILFDYFGRSEVERIHALVPGFTEHVILKLSPLMWELDRDAVRQAIETLEAGGIPNVLGGRPPNDPH